MEKQTKESTEIPSMVGRQTRALTNKSKPSNTPVGHDSPVEEPDENFSSATDQLTVETSTRSAKGSRNKTFLETVSSAISTASTGNLTDEPNDLTVTESERSTTPDPTPTQKQRKAGKKNNKSKQTTNDYEYFQKPSPVPITKRSSTVISTPGGIRSGPSRNDAVPVSPAGQVVSRKTSFENAAIQIQMTNRQIDQFREVVEDNNEYLMARFAKMIGDGEEKMMVRIENFIKTKEKETELNLTNRMTSIEETITENLTAVILKEDRKLEARITAYCNDEIQKMREETQTTAIQRSQRVDNRLTSLELAQKDATQNCQRS